MSYWLAPIRQLEPFTIGKEKIELSEKDALLLRSLFQNLHPFFVPFLKTHILPKGEYDEEGICGVGNFPLPKGVDIIFDGNPLEISKCGMAFLRKLPTLMDIKTYRATYLSEIEQISLKYPAFIETIEAWWENHWVVVIFKD